MYGWRGRIGLVVPSSNTTMESDYHRLAPEGVSVHVARMRFIGASSEEELSYLLKYTGDAVEDLMTCSPKVIVWGCTGASTVPGLEDQVRQMIEAKHHVPCVMPFPAAISALKTLHVSKVSVAAPYTEEVLRGVERHLEGNGVKVINIKGLGLSDNLDIGAQEPQVVYRLARSVDSREAEGIFISCTNFRALDVIEVLERDLGKCVVSSNQAGMWAALTKMGIREPISGYGRLLRQHL